MTFHRLATKTADAKSSIDVARLERDYFQFAADASEQCQFIHFGTNGHRGTSLDGSFTEAHVFAITQAICDYRRSHNITGPVYLGRSTHRLSRLAQRSALEILAGNDVNTVLQQEDGVTPSPVISWTILNHNHRRGNSLADGILFAPTDNLPESGGIKYHSPVGPADRIISKWIQDRANELFRDRLRGVKRALFSSAIRAACTREEDFVAAYTSCLEDVVDLNSIRAADLSLAVDPAGGATLPYWQHIRDRYRLKITLVNPWLDSSCASFPGEGQNVRADCSSRSKQTSLLAFKNRCALSCANNSSGELHGIVTKSANLLRTNDFLAVAIQYLLIHRPIWPRESVVSRTFLSSTLIDRVVHQSNRRTAELPGGFHWFTPGLLNGNICFAADECGGATFLCKDGSPWTTERDGILLALLAAEITARTGKDPGTHYQELARTFGDSYRASINISLTPERKEGLKQLAPESMPAEEIAGEPVLAKFTRAPGNNESLCGVKIVTANGWFAISTTDLGDCCKLSAESFIDHSHLDALLTSARQFIGEISPAEFHVDNARTQQIL